MVELDTLTTPVSGDRTPGQKGCRYPKYFSKLEETDHPKHNYDDTTSLVRLSQEKSL